MSETIETILEHNWLSIYDELDAEEYESIQVIEEMLEVSEDE